MFGVVQSMINLHKIQPVLENKQQIQEFARRQEEIDLFRSVILICQEQTEQLDLFFALKTLEQIHHFSKPQVGFSYETKRYHEDTKE
jgi:hypothetical protein